MTSLKRLRLVLLAVVAGGAVAGPSVSSVSAANGGLVLVVGKGSPISNVTKAELNRLFSADPIKVEGQSVVPFALTPSSAERQVFDLIVLGMGPEEVNKFWIDRRIRGQGNPPKSAPSPEVVAKVVANFPGAMGYLPVGSLTSALKPVAIDGKTYLDPGYLLAQAH
jgi:ABC-type phosphate transport system substrate-binding protein